MELSEFLFSLDIVAVTIRFVEEIVVEGALDSGDLMNCFVVSLSVGFGASVCVGDLSSRN